MYDLFLVVIVTFLYVVAPILSTSNLSSNAASAVDAQSSSTAMTSHQGRPRAASITCCKLFISHDHYEEDLQSSPPHLRHETCHAGESIVLGQRWTWAKRIQHSQLRTMDFLVGNSTNHIHDPIRRIGG